MSSKANLLKPRVLDCIERLRRLVELDAPVPIIGAASFSVFAIVLSAYGDKAGTPLLQHIREEDQHNRGLCNWEDCTNPVKRPKDMGICNFHQKELGIDAETIEDIIKTMEAEQDAR